jgi:sugar-specific transcriptional regulator TrmB
MTNLTNEAQALIQTVEQTAISYMSVKVASNDDLMQCAERLKDIKGKAKELEAQRKSMTAPLDETKKKIMDLFRKPLEMLDQAEFMLKKGMLSYQQEQENIRKEAQRKADEIARKEAEKERAKLEAKIARAEASGKDEKAEELKQQAETIRPVSAIIENTVPVISGIATKKVWKYRVTNVDLIPREYMVVNETLLGNLARSTKGAIKVSGVEFYADDVISASSTVRSYSKELVEV